MRLFFIFVLCLLVARSYAQEPPTALPAPAPAPAPLEPPATPSLANEPEPTVPNDAQPQTHEAAPAPAPASQAAPVPVAPALAAPDTEAAADVSHQAPAAAGAADAGDQVPGAMVTADSSDLSAVAIVPAPGGRLTHKKVPRNVQRVDRRQLDSMHALGVHDALNLRLGSVVLNDVQNNPLQPDLQYRGFTASPLLGVPQGIAVYQNSVRIHDALGDTVQWDLVPEAAIQSIELVPGANPLYGQNALGGGLSIRMKDGFSAPGYRVVGSAGSFERFEGSAEYGHVGEQWASYLALSAFGEEGFRDASRSSAKHAYGDLRLRTKVDEIGIGATLASTDLNGNGPAPVELLAEDRSALFTFPDNTQNELLMLNVDARHLLADRIWISGTAHFRHLRRATLNGDEAEFDECDSGGVLIVCDEEGEPVLGETGTELLSPTTLGPYDGVYNTTDTSSLGYGVSAQVTVEVPLGSLENQLIAGSSFDRSSAAFLQRVELGHLTPERSVLGDGAFAGGEDYRTKLDVTAHHLGIYALDTLTLIDPLAVQAGARFDYTRLVLDDLEGTALDGKHNFARVNPSVGVTFQVIEPITLFASYGEGSRAPSAIELSCADPEEPCRVPNAFVADPPLDQVVTRSVELGVRGEHGGTRNRPAARWSLSGFGSRNWDDILFVAGSQIGTGYFTNAGQTQRIGLEVTAGLELSIVEIWASYTLMRATFEEELVLPAAPNPALAEEEQEPDPDAEEPDPDAEEEAGATIPVEKGDRMPGIPAHSLKAGIDVHPVTGLTLGLGVIAHSDRPYRGDEANLLDGVDGYAVLNAHASYWVLDNLQLFVKAENVLDSEYETFGLLADPSEVLDGYENPRFLGPGAPLGVFAGVVVRGM